MAHLPIYAILFFSLFGGSLIRLGIPGYFAVGTELLVITLFLHSLLTRPNTGGLVLHFWYSFFFMVLIAVSSIVLNASGPLQGLLSLRLLYRFYFFYLAIININLDDRRTKKLNTFIAMLFLFQLPFVAYNFHLYGIDERTQGAYAAKHCGSMTTILPIVVVFYAASYYFLYRPRLLYILAGLGFVIFSIVGGKRAVAFLYPIQFLAIYYYVYVKGKRANLSKRVGVFVAVLISVVITSGSIFCFNKTLNPERSVGGSVDVEYAFEFAKEYTTRESRQGYTWGRYSTTIRVFEKLLESDFPQFFFGVGPGSTTSSIFDSATARAQSTLDRFGIGYGLTSMTRIAIEYGVLGVIAYGLIIVLCARMCWKYFKYEVDPYWKAFAAGSVGFAFSMFFFFVAYSHSAFWGDTAPAIYFYAMGVIYTRWRRIEVRVSQPNALTAVPLSTHTSH